MPTVSIIIPTYNRCDLLLQTINSVLAQDSRDFEILVIDDGSTDHTGQTVAEIKDNRIKYFPKNNGGRSSARNFGLKKAQGQFICFLDSDDLWPGNFLRTMTSRLQKNPQYGAAYCMRTLLFEDGSTKPSYQKEFFFSGQITSQLFQKTFIQTSTICFRREILEDIFFDESLNNGEDVDVWLKISTRTKFLFVPDIQIIYRQQTLPDTAEFDSKYCNRIRVLERFYFKLGGNKYIPRKIAMRKLSYAYRSAAKKALKAGCRKAAIELTKMALQFQKWQIRLYLDLIKAYNINRKNDKMPDWQMPKPLEINGSSIAGEPK
ncbi:MAG: glycosyltransferase family A protein [Phycisphaerae bacterium]|nr:glycosyltransferase family A protein [Phycisphaerae bacterium]